MKFLAGFTTGILATLFAVYKYGEKVRRDEERIERIRQEIEKGNLPIN